MKKIFFLAIFFVLILILGSVLFFATPLLSPAVDKGSASVEINGTIITVEMPQTNEEFRQGLSGRETLDPNSGMLFVFDKPDIYEFWVPNMNFPIDIIWINDDVVVDISKDVSNDFDENNPVTYTPPEPAQYVLEVNAGFAKENNIQIGDSVRFNNIAI